MTVSKTIQMLAPFVQMVDVRNHFSGLFRVPAGGIHNKYKVKVDVRRSKEDVSFPVANKSTQGWHFNERKGFSSKELTPPTYKEAISISADDLMFDRAFGRDPYNEPGLMTRLQDDIGPLVSELQDMISRGLEIQASQIMTTGALAITDDAGTTVLSESFNKKSAHFPNASVDWDTTGSAVPLTDIAGVCDLIKQNGHRQAIRVHMSAATFQGMLATDSVKAALNNDYRIDNGSIYRINTGAQPAHGTLVGGGIFRGILQCRQYVLDIYTYSEGYNNPQTGTWTAYLADDLCVVESGGRMDATFGALNTFGTNGNMLGRMRFGGGASNPLTNFTVLQWKENDGTAIHTGVGTRGLLFPVEIDSFGCITTSGF